MIDCYTSQATLRQVLIWPTPKVFPCAHYRIPGWRFPKELGRPVSENGYIPSIIIASAWAAAADRRYGSPIHWILAEEAYILINMPKWVKRLVAVTNQRRGGI